MDTPIDVDKDSQWKHDSEFVKIIKNMYGTCGIRPGWRCRRRWAWLRGLWHIWEHSQSISLEKLDIKHVPYMFLIILTNSLSCFHWLSSSTSMGVSMTPNRVQTYFSVYNPAPRAGPENFIITYILKPSVLCSLRKFLPQIRWRPPPPLTNKMNNFLLCKFLNIFGFQLSLVIITWHSAHLYLQERYLQTLGELKFLGGL